MEGVATVETFEQLKAANADLTVTKIVVNKAITVAESFSIVKPVDLNGGITVAGSDVSVTFANVSGESIQCKDGASLHISGLVEHTIITGIQDDDNKLCLYFGTVSETSDFYLTGTTIYGTLNVGICEFDTGLKYPWPIGSSKLNVPAEKTSC